MSVFELGHVRLDECCAKVREHRCLVNIDGLPCLGEELRDFFERGLGAGRGRKFKSFAKRVAQNAQSFIAVIRSGRIADFNVRAGVVLFLSELLQFVGERGEILRGELVVGEDDEVALRGQSGGNETLASIAWPLANLFSNVRATCFDQHGGKRAIVMIHNSLQ